MIVVLIDYLSKWKVEDKQSRPAEAVFTHELLLLLLLSQICQLGLK